MTILWIILGVIASLIVLLLIVASFVRKDYSVEREVIVNRPQAEVFSYLRLIRNQEQYNKWAMKDPQMKTTSRGTDGTVGFVYTWEGNKEAGAGEQEIKSIHEGERVDLEIRFIRPFAAVGQIFFNARPVSAGQTTVSWGMRSSMKYPMNIMLVLFNLEKALSKDMDESLLRMKSILEQQTAATA